MYIQPNAKSRLMGSSSPGNRKAHTHHAQIPKLLQVFLQIFFVPEHPFLRPPVVCTWGSIPPASKRHCNANKLALGSGNVSPVPGSKTRGSYCPWTWCKVGPGGGALRSLHSPSTSRTCAPQVQSAITTGGGTRSGGGSKRGERMKVEWYARQIPAAPMLTRIPRVPSSRRHPSSDETRDILCDDTR